MVVIYNPIGALFAGVGIVVGVIAGVIGVPTAGAVAIGGFATFIVDVIYRRSSGDFDNRGGRLYYVPVFVLGLGLAIFGAGLQVVRSVGSKQNPIAEAPTQEPVELDAVLSQRVNSFAVEFDRIAQELSSNCREQQSQLKSLVERNRGLLIQAFGTGTGARVRYHRDYSETDGLLFRATNAARLCDGTFWYVPTN